MTNHLCQFDFLSGLKLYQLKFLGASLPEREALHFPNFARFYGYRLQALMDLLKEEPECFHGLFGEEFGDLVSAYLSHIKDYQRENIFLSWSRPKWDP